MKPKIGDTVQFKKSGIKGTVEKILRGVCIVDTPVSKLSAWPEDLIICGLSEVSLDKEMEEHQRTCDEIMEIQGIKPIEAEIEEAKTYWDSIKDAWICPDGYIFKDENGNVINATKIVLEKKEKEYPKTYEECAGRIMRVELWNTLWGEDATEYEEQTEDLIDAFIRLKICRDAYWKIAGDELGLGKPWEPDWKNSEEKRYCIVNIEGDINLPEKVLTKWILKVTNKILVFPTAEMRNAFYENFKEEIEECKELL